MGQKVHPGGLRLGIIHPWKAHWYTERHFADYLHEDLRIRKYIRGKMGHAGLSDIVIRKDTNKIVIDIFTARPGIVIGKSGSEVDALRREIHDMTGKNVQVNITEIKRPGTGRQPGGAVHRRAALQSGELPAGDETGHHLGHAIGGGGHQGQVRRSAGRRRDGARRGLQRGPGAPTHPSGRHRLWLLGSQLPPSARSA